MDSSQTSCRVTGLFVQTSGPGTLRHLRRCNCSLVYISKRNAVIIELSEQVSLAFRYRRHHGGAPERTSSSDCLHEALTRFTGPVYLFLP